MRGWHDQRILNQKLSVEINNIDDTDLKNLIQALKRELKRRKELKCDDSVIREDDDIE